MPDRWDPDRLYRMLQLEPGWNGYSAEPPSKLAVDTARNYLACIPEAQRAAVRIAPSAVGGVGITQRRGPLKAYVECFNDGECYYLLSDGVTPATSQKANVDPTSMSTLARTVEWYLASPPVMTEQGS